MKVRFALIIILFLSQVLHAQEMNSNTTPDFKDVISLKRVGSPVISPDGSSILYSVTTTDWKNNRYDTEIWLSRNGKEAFQLTNTPDGSSSSPKWSPNGTQVTFLADRGSKNQIYILNVIGGEARQLTDHKDGIRSYSFSPDGTKIAFSASDSANAELKAREKDFGRFEEEDAQYRMRHLWVGDVKPEGKVKGTRLTSGNSLTVGSFEWAPDSKKIAFDHRADPLINSYPSSDISIIDADSHEISPLVTQDGSDSSPHWSPDGRWILFSTTMGDNRYYVNGEYARISVDGGAPEVLTRSFDENLRFISWNSKGAFFTATQHVYTNLFKLDIEKKTVSMVADNPENISSVSFSKSGDKLAILAYNSTSLPEIYTGSLNNYNFTKITDMTAQVSSWQTGTREVIEWKSKDNAVIEGILWKPANFDASKRYPLLVIIHGGPTGTSRPTLIGGGVYPYQQWLEKGAVILQPNYRGSAGYGEAFRTLNVSNLGVGDAWDVESGVDYLIDKGIADKNRVGSMGWSQGGYISAFLTTTSTKFKAISVGAGISNWMTYYVNTDIHPFTRYYLEGTPWSVPDVYAKTSPMTYISKAQTPTLIQHGEFDQRVPIPNARELYQGLQDVGVTTKLIVYKDFGHGISRPKERLAAVWHNWQWFAQYIWDEKVDFPINKNKN